MLLQQKLGAFVWSKMGAESGQPPDVILHWKEMERRAHGGKFAWGIGHSPGDFFAPFMQSGGRRMAVFTKITGNPKECDVKPEKHGGVVFWRAYKTRQGDIEPLPPHSFVSGRFTGRKHCALLCECDESLLTQHHGELHPSRLVHYKTGNPIAGQNITTAVKEGEGRGKQRPIVFAASLYCEGWVELADCVDISQRKVDELMRSAVAGDVEKWKALISKIKG